MSARVILRGAALKLCAERAEAAPASLYSAACLACAGESELVADDPKPVQGWAIEHAEAYGLTHSQFRVTAHDYWRVDAAHVPVGATPWPPASDRAATPVTAVPNAPVRHSVSHARRRGRWLGRRVMQPVATGVGRIIAPVLVSAFVLASVLWGVLPGCGRSQHAATSSFQARGGT